MTAFDLDGRPLGNPFPLRRREGGPTDVRAIAVDEDRRIWAADASSASVRAFRFSGLEVDRIDSVGEPDSDRPGALGDLAGIAVQGVESETRVLISRHGHRRHALFLLSPGGQGVRAHSFRPDGDPQGSFRNLAGVAIAGTLAFACEPGTNSIQVFREGEFHYRIPMPPSLAPHGAHRRAGRLEPRLVAPLADGRLVVACGGTTGSALLHLDANGRVLSTLAADGTEEGRVHLPSGLAVEDGCVATTRVAVLDLDHERVQMFTLDGRCYGTFIDPESADLAPRIPSGEGPDAATHAENGGAIGAE